MRKKEETGMIFIRLLLLLLVFTTLCLIIFPIMKNRFFGLLPEFALQSTKASANAVSVQNNLAEAISEAAFASEQVSVKEPDPAYAPGPDDELLSTMRTGMQYGTIVIERLGMQVPLYYGDSNSILKKGAGQYTGSSMPGQGSQILICAHNTNYFKPLQNIEENDLITVTTSYGEFHYQVCDIRIASMKDTTTYNLSLTHEQLVLYTCYPFTGPPGKTERFFVYADLI